MNDQVRPSRFRLYIDESGDHSTNLLEDDAHRFLALLGAWFEQGDYIKFADELGSLKRDLFGARPDKPIVFHRSDMINCKGAFYRLRDPSFRSRLDEGLLEIIGRAQFTLVCVVIDKKNQRDRYAQLASPFSLHPYHFCLAALLFRYSRWLLARNAVGDVVAESRGRAEDLQLKNAYRNIYESGTNALSRESYQRALTSKEIKLEPKRASLAGIELADLLAHPIKTFCLASKNLASSRGGPFSVRLQEAVVGKFLLGKVGVENPGCMCF